MTLVARWSLLVQQDILCRSTTVNIHELEASKAAKATPSPMSATHTYASDLDSSEDRLWTMQTWRFSKNSVRTFERNRSALIRV
jgi:hypothetical protein